MTDADPLASDPKSLPEPNYDEAQIPSFELPPVLSFTDGSPVSATEWPRRRAELLDLFRHHVYGLAPESGWQLHAELLHSHAALGGLAVADDIEVTLRTAVGERRFSILLHRPHQPGIFPTILGCNFAGNHTVSTEAFVRLTPSWVPNRPEGVHGPAASEAGRGLLARRWPLAMAVARGYAVATVYSGELEPDKQGAASEGLRGLFPQHHGPHAWGTIACWAFGLRRALDALLAVSPAVDAGHVITLGHSRMGKTALLAAAEDERFFGAVSNGSGCTGAALSRRCIGERLQHINTRFPHWFNDFYSNYNDREQELPIDQHQLLALIAPRFCCVSSAENDVWADPKGEWLSVQAARPAYALLGLPSDPEPAGYPALNRAQVGPISYHVRAGEHDMLPMDWQFVLDRLDCALA